MPTPSWDTAGGAGQCKLEMAVLGFVGTCTFRATPGAAGSGLKDAPLGACTVGQPLSSSSRAFCFPHVLIGQAHNWIQPEILYSADLILTAQRGVLGWLQTLCVNNLIPQKKICLTLNLISTWNTPVQAMEALSRWEGTSKVCCRQQDKTKSVAGEIRA